VLVDKPVTATAKEAKELGELAKAKGLVLYPFQNRRWDSDFLALRRLLALPESTPHSLGAIVEFESQSVSHVSSVAYNILKLNHAVLIDTGKV
jgi:predicted dehydrogenase